MRTHLLSLLMVVGALAAPASADISLDSSQLTVFAKAGNIGTKDDLLPSSLPFSGSHNISFGGSDSRATYDFSATGDTGAFEFDFDQVREGTELSRSQGGGNLKFSVTNDVLYSFDGVYTLDQNAANRFFQSVLLVDETAGFTTVFRNVQESRARSGESFTLGGTGGDFANILEGDISGTLTAGHTYALVYNYFTEAHGADAGATAVGNFNMNLSPIPAPGAALLAMLGFGLVARVKRQRRA